MTSKSTREQATDAEIQMLIDSHEKGTAMFMRTDACYFMAKELQERRKADSEPVELPLDYLQGHKDGLEWASQLAKANHPETGDWLYDDPIELAKAIRKGPDMPPSQPALDTEPVAYTDDRNLGYIDRGRETAYLWGKQNSEAGDIPLYRHAQQSVVRPAPECEHQWRHGGANKLQNQKQCIKCGRVELDAQQPVVPDENTLRIQGIEALEEFLTATTPEPEMVGGIKLTMACCRVLKAIIKNKGWADFNDGKPEKVKAETIISALREPHSDACGAAMLQAGDTPVIPDGYVMVPKEMTDEIGEAIAMQANCCGGIALDIYDAMLAVAPQEVNRG